MHAAGWVGVPARAPRTSQMAVTVARMCRGVGWGRGGRRGAEGKATERWGGEEGIGSEPVGFKLGVQAPKGAISGDSVALRYPSGDVGQML